MSLPPGQRAIGHFPRFGISFWEPPPRTATPALIRLAGAITHHLEVPVSRLAELTRRDVVADFHCVTGWTAQSLHWGGVSFRTFYESVIASEAGPQPGVSHILFHGADGYRSVLTLDDALDDDVLLADRLGGTALDSDHGAPVRLLSPKQYGYKSTKHLCCIELHTREPADGHRKAVVRFLVGLVNPHPPRPSFGARETPLLARLGRSRNLPETHSSLGMGVPPGKPPRDMNAEQLFRALFIAIFIPALSISVYFRRKARNTGDVIPRAREGRLSLSLRILFATPLYLAMFAYMANPNWMAWSSMPLSSWLRWVGAAIGLGMLPLLFWILRTLGSNVSETFLTKEHHALVTHGPYRSVRHPLYTVATIAFISLGILAANWFMMAMAILAIMLIFTVVIPREEDHLIRKFGIEYRDYKERTNRLLPRLDLIRPRVQAGIPRHARRHVLSSRDLTPPRGRRLGVNQCD